MPIFAAMRRNISTTIRFSFYLCFLLACCAGCGGSGSSHDDSLNGARVENIGTSDSELDVGDGTVAAADFSFDFEHVADDGDVFIVIHLPVGLELREGTSEIEKADDTRVDAHVTLCTNGESYVAYQLDSNDLDEALPPSRNAAARLKFTIDAVEANSDAVIEAVAGTSLPVFSCTSSFISDEAVAIRVN